MENITRKKSSLEELVNFIENEGFNSDFNTTSKYRYSLVKDPITLILGAKIPVFFPLKITPPSEITTFYISLAIQTRNPWVSDKFRDNSRIVARIFRKLVEKLKPYKHEFNFTGYRPKIRDLIQKYRSNQKNTTENPSIEEIFEKTRIRDKYLREKDEDTFETCLKKLSQDVLSIYRDFHLRPTNKKPPEIFNGYPRGRENFTVIFKSEDPNQYLLEEPGCVSYWRDYHYKNIWTRTGFECLWAKILYQAFSDKDYRLNYLLYDWIVYARGLIKPIVETLDKVGIDFQEFQPFSEVKLLKDILRKKEHPGIFVPTMTYEAMQSEELVERSKVLFDSAPTSLVEVSAIDHFIQAEYLMKRNDLQSAKQKTAKALVKLKEAHHAKGELKCLFRLYEISEAQKKYAEGVKILERALEIAKLNACTVQEISKIHNLMIKAYGNKGNNTTSERHFVINLKFLESLDRSAKVEKLIVETHLEMFKLRLKQKKIKLAKEHLKSLAKHVKKYPEYEFLFLYWRAKYEQASGNKKVMLNLLEKADEIQEGGQFEHILTKFELAKHFLYNEKKTKKALDYLEQANRMIKSIDVKKLKLKIKIFEMMRDAYNALNDSQKVQAVSDQVKNLREQLDRFN